MLRFYVANEASRVRFEHAGGPVELGRDPRRDGRHVIRDPLVSNDQLRAEELSGGRVRLDNLSRRVPVTLADGTSLAPGAGREFGLPVRLTVGGTLVEIEGDPDRDEDVDRASLRSVAPPLRRSTATDPVSVSELGEAPSAGRLARWLETVISVQRSSASSPDFYSETARAVVDLVGLDRGLVLLRRGGGWEVVARHGAGPGYGPEFSRSVLSAVLEERQTFYQEVPGRPGLASLAGVSAVVAAPVLSDDGGPVVGAVYGARDQRPGQAAAAVRPLEAQLVQVLAAAVGVGLARLGSEAEAARRRVQFEQFFSPELSRELDRDPALLDGREREVTVLFSDVRGFSRISERLTPRETFDLVGDVMQRLTERVREHRGVVVDYVGDGLLAVWNAPADEPEHADLACRAALAMLSELPALNGRWGERVGGPLGLGIGLNTGPALVGNTGSRSKFKYGPLGHTVNLASRVEGATKQIGVPALITGATRARLNGAFATRRLGSARVVGITGEVELHELHAGSADGHWLAARGTFEAGLALFESDRCAEACQALYPLLAGQEGRYDLPTLALVGRAVERLRSPALPFDPVLELTSK
jgi:adenylate cyclase